MKCVVPGPNVKILARAIHALAKIGDEMYVQPLQDALSLRTVNMANSAYSDFTFFENYFSYYVYGDLEEDDALKCKISMRSALAVFKAPNLIDKQVETCHINLKPNASDILFILKYKNSITKTHLLPILDCEKLQAAYDKDEAPNYLSSQPRVLGDAVYNFYQNLLEITLEASPQKLLLRNYVDDISGMSNTTRTQLALSTGEFDKYSINNETTITFCMKELKAILNFAETVGVPLGIHFETAGRPIIFVLKSASFEGNLVLSTINPDMDSQTETTITDKREMSTKKRNTSKRTSKRSNKSSSKLENRSNKSNKTLEKPGFPNEHANSMETRQESASTASLIQTINKEIDEFLITTDREPVRKITKNNNDGIGNQNSLQQSSKKENRGTPSRSSMRVQTNETPSFQKKLVNSVFSTITKRKSSRYIDTQNDEENNGIDVAENEVPNSPPHPAKKARMIFKKCFQTTFDSRMLPGHDIVLAEDSDECASD